MSTKGFFYKIQNYVSQKAISIIEEKHQNVPATHFSNDISSFFEIKRGVVTDVIALDWDLDMKNVSETHCCNAKISGNVNNLDPDVFFFVAELIKQAVKDDIHKHSRQGVNLLNLGHNDTQGKPEQLSFVF